MTLKVLINGISLEGGNLVPLLLKVKTWQELGCQVTFLGSKILKEQIEDLQLIDSFQFIKFSSEKEYDNRLLFMIKALKDNFFALYHVNRLRNQYHIIYSISSILSLVIFPYFLKLYDKKIIWMTVFDNTVPLQFHGNKVASLCAWLFFNVSIVFIRKADKVFVISDELYVYLIKKKFSRKQIVTTGNAIETGLISQAKRDERYHIDALFIGRIHEAKGIYDMLHVLKIIKRYFSDFQLAIMGKGTNGTETQLKRKIKKMDLTSNVQFLGYKTGIEKYTIIKSSKLFLFLSYSESFGVALLEGVCSGLPAVAYELEIYKKIYKKNEVFFFLQKDIQSVADKIIDVFSKKEFGNKTGLRLLNHYSWEDIAKKEIFSIA